MKHPSCCVWRTVQTDSIAIIDLWNLGVSGVTLALDCE